MAVHTHVPKTKPRKPRPSKMLVLLFVLGLPACAIDGDTVRFGTIDKAVYFHAAQGHISAGGIQLTGEDITYHSMPCNKQGDCVVPGHPKVE